MALRSIREFEVRDKKVLLRADFNVAIDETGEAADDFRVRMTLPTINYLCGRGAKIILLAHLGRPLEKDGVVTAKERQAMSLAPVARRLSQLLAAPVKFLPDCLGEAVALEASRLTGGEILMLENLRFYPGEERNDENFAKGLAALGELYVNDAFGDAHRAHASIDAVARFLPSAAGLLLESEVRNLARVRDNAERPLCAIIGGAKISTKIKLIKSFLNKADDIILGGALANTVLRAKGIATGKSLVEESVLPELNKLEITNTRLHLPVDAMLCVSGDDPQTCHCGPVGLMQDNESIFDIGFDTRELFSRIICAAKTIIWNGPMGMFEQDFLAQGTAAVARAISSSGAFSVIGGGETIAYLEKAGIIDKFSFVSTGGGAMMEFLTGEKLPGIEALDSDTNTRIAHE